MNHVNPVETSDMDDVAALRSILLKNERPRLEATESHIAQLQDYITGLNERLDGNIQAMLASIDAASQTSQSNKKTIEDICRDIEAWQQLLQSSTSDLDERLAGSMSAVRERAMLMQQDMDDSAQQLESLTLALKSLGEQAVTDTDSLKAMARPVFSEMVDQAVIDTPNYLAESLGPVMGNAIKTQIREDRASMIEALYPVIGQIVQRAVTEAMRELQRNIDKRLSGSFGNQGILKRLSARLRGVSEADLTMRESLPFEILQMFLIQRGSGLLIAHINANSSAPTAPDVVEMGDYSDVISSMLTAIRAFVQDSFANEGQDYHLETIEYGEQRIIIQEGQAAYLAVVINGIEPPGFHAALRTLISELHVTYQRALADYNGNTRKWPDLEKSLSDFVMETRPDKSTASVDKSLVLRQALVAGGFLSLLIIILLYI